MKKMLLTLCFSCFVCACQSHEAAITLLDGDLVFQDSPSAQSRAVQFATGSKYSHVGMILINQGKTMVCEAVQPVKMTPWADWIGQGKDRHYVVKRLKERSLWFNEDAVSKLKKIAAEMQEKNYDALFGWGDDRIYCSELVWKSYEHALGLQLCALKTLKDFNLSNPEVKRILKERYGNNVPYNEKVVSPADLFDSILLVEVVRKGELP